MLVTRFGIVSSVTCEDKVSIRDSLLIDSNQAPSEARRDAGVFGFSVVHTFAQARCQARAFPRLTVDKRRRDDWINCCRRYNGEVPNSHRASYTARANLAARRRGFERRKAISQML